MRKLTHLQTYAVLIVLLTVVAGGLQRNGVGTALVLLLGAGITYLLLRESPRQQALNEKKLRYRELFDANPQPMWVYDLETLMFLAVNDAAVALYGYTRDELLAMRITDIRPPEEVIRLMQRLAEVRKADVRDAGRWRHRRKDGTLIDVEITAHTLDFGGRRAQIVHVNDVTERLRVEYNLRESEERYRALTDLSSDWYWEQDANLRFTLMSKPNAGQEDIDLDTFVGKTRRAATGVLWDESQLAALDAIVEARLPFRDFEIGRTYRDGPKRYVQMSGEPIFDASGRFAGYRGIGKDITERKRVEAALHESEARFRALTEMSSDFYWESDAEHRLIARSSANKELSTVSVFQKGAQIGERRWDIPYLSPDESGWRAHRALLDAHLPFRHFELSRLGTDGTERHISISGDPVFDASGGFKGYRGVGADITERKRAEAHLRLAASVFDHAHEAITITDADANIVSVNRRFTEITGYSADEAVGRNPRMLRSGRQGEDFYQAMWASIDTDGYWTGELWNQRKDGRVFPEWLSISAVRGERGQVINYIAVFVDISERVAAEQALRASEEKFAKAFRSSPMFISISTVADGRYIDVNDAYLRGTGYARGEVIGHTAHEIALWNRPQDRQRATDLLLNHGRISGFEAELRKKSGATMVCEIWAEPIVIEDVPCVIWITNDATVRKKAETEIRQLNAELERRVAERTQALEVANKELESFSYSVSHDLRAPLRAIHGFSRLVEQQYASQIDEQGRDMLRRVGAGAERMGHLIDDLLKLSRISRQAMQIEPVDLSALAWEVVGDLQADAPERRVEWVIAPQVSAEGDPGLLRVVLQNLIGNAWKYSARRELARIEFGVGEKDGRPVYFVNDNGAGFDMAHAKKLFGAFQRLHSTAEFPGSGIGLATVARVIHRHGGEVSAEGRVGKGASFYFSLGADPARALPK